MKHRIATVTFNPAIDETIAINNFKAGSVNRVSRVERYPGGKGINVATFISDYGYQCSCTGFLGKQNDSIFINHFLLKNITDSMVRIEGETRTGIKIIDEKQEKTTDINYPGITPTEEDITLLERKIETLTEDHDIFVVSGSLPVGTDPSLYGAVVSLLKKKGAAVVIDTSGPAFIEAVQSGPDIIKPNNHELEEYSGKKLNSFDDYIKAASDFFSNGIKTVIVSMGSKGALFVTENEVLHALPPKTRAISTVGAGDAMVAGTVCALVEKLPLADTAKLATAFSLNAVSHIRLGLHKPGELNKIVESVQIQKI